MLLIRKIIAKRCHCKNFSNDDFDLGCKALALHKNFLQKTLLCVAKFVIDGHYFMLVIGPLNALIYFTIALGTALFAHPHST